MKLTLSCLHQTVALAAVSWALVAPISVVANDRTSPRPTVAPLGTPVQQVNYDDYNYVGNGTCPNGDCQGGGIRGWGGFGGGGSCWGGGWYGRCHNGLAHGNAFVRPPAVWPVARTPNTYGYYWSPQLMGVPAGTTGLQYPMIYHPTDTTQLGFSYQHVPRWGYRPGMLPPPPAPNWPLGQYSAFGLGAPVYDSTVVLPGTPVANEVVPVTPAPVAVPAPVIANPPIKVPPPPAEPEATFFPGRARR